MGRRELLDARRWVGERRWRRTAARPVSVEGMLAVRDRAAGASARAAILRADSESADPAATDARSGAQAPAAVAPARPVVERPAPIAARPPAAGPAVGPAVGPAAAPAAAPEPEATDTLARLREAKKRARS